MKQTEMEKRKKGRREVEREAQRGGQRSRKFTAPSYLTGADGAGGAGALVRNGHAHVSCEVGGNVEGQRTNMLHEKFDESWKTF